MIENRYPADLGTVEYPIAVGGYGVYVHVVPKEISSYEFDKYYVGITNNMFCKRWCGGGGYSHQPFGNAIKKYGWENIKHVIISDHIKTKIDALMLEQILIRALQSFRAWGHGYNGTLGGDGISGIEPTNYNDITGRTFGRLTVLYRNGVKISPSGNKRAVWHCICSCDAHTEIDVTYGDIVYGNTTSCGCLLRERRLEIEGNEYTFSDIDKSVIVGHTKTGKQYLFDADKYKLLSKYTWFESKHRNGDIFLQYEKEVNGKRYTGYIVDLLLGLPEGNVFHPKIDYVNGNNQDLRLDNLEIVIPDGADRKEYLYYVYSGGLIHLNFANKRWKVFTHDSARVFKTLTDAIQFHKEYYGIATPRIDSHTIPIICLNSLEIIRGGAPEATMYTDVKRAAINHSCTGKNEFGGRNLKTGEKLKWMRLQDYNNLSIEDQNSLKSKYYTGNKLVMKEGCL